MSAYGLDGQNRQSGALLNISGSISYKELVFNILANGFIAVLLWIIGFGDGFLMNLAYSEAIGLSIFLYAQAVKYYLRNQSGWLRFGAYAVAVILGVLSGIVVVSLFAGIEVPVSDESAYLVLQLMLLSLMFAAVIWFILKSQESVFLANRRVAEEKVKTLETEKRASEAELLLFQSQMEPHFIVNTLANISSLADSDSNKAKMAINDLSEFLRAFLTRITDKKITLAQEIMIIEKYLSIAKIRMEDRLTYRITIPDALVDMEILPLLLQPLVENAVKHGLEPQVLGGAVELSAEVGGGHVKFTVSDTGAALNGFSDERGTGLDNIRKRLGLHYGGGGRMYFESNTPSGVRAIIEVPYCP